MSISSIAHKRCLKNLDRIWREDGCPYETAFKLIEGSAWFNQPQSGWVRAPNHAQRLSHYGCNNELGVKFGSHVFYVSRATNYAFLTLEQAINELKEDPPQRPCFQSWKSIQKALFEGIAIAVGDEYGNYYNYGTIGFKDKEGMLVFGNQGIFIPNFIGIIIDAVEINSILAEFS